MSCAPTFPAKSILLSAGPRPDPSPKNGVSRVNTGLWLVLNP